MCEKDVSLAYSSGITSTGSSPVAAPFAYQSDTSLQVAPLCAVTHRTVTSLSLVWIREQTSIAATAGTKSFVPQSGDGGGGVDKDCILPAALRR